MRQSWTSASLALAAAASAHLALLALPWLDLWPEPPQTEPAVEVELQAIASKPAATTKTAPDPTRQITTTGSSDRQVAKPQAAPVTSSESAVSSRSGSAANRHEPAQSDMSAKTSKPDPIPEKTPRSVEPSTPAASAPSEVTGQTQQYPPPQEGSRITTNRDVDDGHAEQPTAGASETGNQAAIRQGYRKTLEAHLARYRQYPAMALMRRQEGTITVAFTIDKEGHLVSSKLLGHTPYPLLNREALALIERASPFPDVPATLIGEDLYWELPVHFRLNEQSR